MTLSPLALDAATTAALAMIGVEGGVFGQVLDTARALAALTACASAGSSLPRSPPP